MTSLEDLERLTQVMPTPDPPDAPDIGWDEVEADFGIALPPGYRALLDDYGYGSVDGELVIYDPRHRIGRSGIEELMYPDGPERDLMPLPPFEPPPGPDADAAILELAPRPDEPRSLFPVARNGNGDGVYLVVENDTALDIPLWVGKRWQWVEIDRTLPGLILDVVQHRADYLLSTFAALVWSREPRYLRASDTMRRPS